jgi:predicted membrane-bound mannosyltransferase
VRHALAAIAGAAIPVLLLYSSFFRHPAAVLDAVSALPIYVSRGLDPGPHAQPWFYYLQTLGWSSSGGLVWSEALVLVLAGVGIVRAIAQRRFWPLCLSLYAVGTMVVFSAVTYKTPWNVLPFYAGLILMAGVGAAAIVHGPRSPIARALVVLGLAVATGQLAMQSARASFRYGADERNPYVYAHTSPDYLRLAARVHDLAAVHPQGRDMLVAVVAGPHEQWPFPWYARDMTRVGYWVDAASAGSLDGVPAIVASMDNMAAVEAALGERYISEYYGLRPGVLVALYVEPDLWERFMASRR